MSLFARKSDISYGLALYFGDLESAIGPVCRFSCGGFPQGLKRVEKFRAGEFEVSDVVIRVMGEKIGIHCGAFTAIVDTRLAGRVLDVHEFASEFAKD